MTQPHQHKARKRFGQNFLQDHAYIDRIVDAIKPVKGECLVEIGPGLGALTYPVLERVGQLHVIELDRDIIPLLEAGSQPYGDLTIHSADALKFDYASLVPDSGNLKVYGNLPYNISTPLIFHLFSYAQHISEMHFMLQKEVVDRMVAEPGSKQYGRLSVMTQYHCQAQKLFNVPPIAFRPAPKVMSSIVRLLPYKEKPVLAKDEKHLNHLVTTAFNFRRKTLRNALKSLIDEEGIEALGIASSLRPEALSLADYVALANATT
jgi:16S rRNA (adenine1518-N6/adenine1519-N6)-dimethyltransferase